jgi:vancomycin permeability regulator SanA
MGGVLLIMSIMILYIIIGLLSGKRSGSFRRSKKKVSHIKLMILFGLSWFAIQSAMICYDGFNDEVSKSDAVLILGNKVNEDGSLSLRLKSRVDKGYDIYCQGLAEKIVVSGGKGKEGIPEGSAMKEYLVRKGAEPKDILIDNYGINTYWSARNYKEIAECYEFNSVIVVSQYHHISRSKMIFNKLKVGDVSSAHCCYFELSDAYSIFREFFAFYKYLIWY